MAKHAPETRTEQAPSQGAVDYFRAKLAYETTPWELNEALKKSESAPVIVDVRDEQQFAAGHIKGAKNIPLGKMVENLASLPKDKDVVTYCGSITCAMSTKAALELAQKGYRVRHMLGGFASWNEMGFATESAT